MVTEEQVWEKLKLVIDPELGIDIVSLGLVYKVEVRNQKTEVSSNTENENYKVFVLMTLTSPHCPLAGMFDDLVTGAVRQIKEIKRVDIELTFDPPWDVSKASDEARAEMGFF